MTTVNKSSTSESSGKKPQKPEAGGSPVDQFMTYLKGVRSEWGKISWPSKPQIWGQTIVVLVMVTIMTLGLFVLDNLFHYTITAITPHRG